MNLKIIYVAFQIMAAVVLAANDKSIDVNKYKWVINASPSITDTLIDYHKKFQEENLTVFLHADILSTDSSMNNDTYDYTIPTTDGNLNAKFVQGYLSAGYQKLFFLVQGIEVPTQSATMQSSHSFDSKEYALASYWQSENFDILVSGIYRVQPRFKEINGTDYFDASDEKQTSTWLNAIGSIYFLDIGLFYSDQSSVEKVFLNYDLSTKVGDFGIKYLRGKSPISYNDISLKYDSDLFFSTNLKIIVKDRILDKKSADYSDGLVNTQIIIDKVFNSNELGVDCFMAYSKNSEFTTNPIDGYKFNIDLFDADHGHKRFEYFIGLSKNYVDDLQRLPLTNELLLSIGLKISGYI